VAVQPVIPAHERLRQEVLNFKASLRYVARPFLKDKQQQKTDFLVMELSSQCFVHWVGELLEASTTPTKPSSISF
jgi:hypothetical protein